MDWSRLAALSERKYGGLGIAYTKCTVLEFPYTPIPKWCIMNSKLVDDPGSQFQRVGN